METKERTSLQLSSVAYRLPDNSLLFENVNLFLGPNDKAALVGNNGTGKSTLLDIIAGEKQPAGGSVAVGGKLYRVPQLFGQFNELGIAEALNVADKLEALREIERGSVDEANFALLDDDWDIEERCREAMNHWRIDCRDLSMKIGDLSGGQKTGVFLAGILIHRPDLVLLDEPTNHLDGEGRRRLYELLESFAGAMLTVSHDRTLLGKLDTIHELNPAGIKTCGGSYEFYREQRDSEINALSEELRHREKELRKARETQRKAMERQQKKQSRAGKNRDKSGLPPILLGARKSAAENSAAGLKTVHAKKTDAIARELSELRKELPVTDSMKCDFDDSSAHKGKTLVEAVDVNFRFGERTLWSRPLSFVVSAGERIRIEGANGSGKTTLLKLILGELSPSEGKIARSFSKTLVIDQDYSPVNVARTVYEQAQTFNNSALPEHEVKTRLNRFLFPKNDWDKSCLALSGGEKMRLLLCCLTIDAAPPDMIILDEPTNNLDIQNMEILTSAVNDYRGTLLVVSHDEYFVAQIKSTTVIFAR
jgi:ATPase subunit of ABC transporter with duplicated ATPase domains